MQIYSKKITCVVLSCLVWIFCGIATGQDMHSRYVASSLLMLHKLPSYKQYPRYESVETFIDANSNIIVLCCYSFEDEETYSNRHRLSLYVLANGTWVNSSLVLSHHPSWHGMVNNGVFQAYAIQETEGAQTVLVYGLTSDLKLSPQPIKTINLNLSKKVFENEEHREIQKLLPLPNNPDSYFVLGTYTISILNPITLIFRVYSGGHDGYAEGLFGAVLEQGKITRYYKCPVRLENNDRADAIVSIVNNNKAHVTWQKSREYSEGPVIIEYTNFDFDSNQWSSPVELFKASKYTRKGILDECGTSSLFCDEGNVYCVWPRYVKTVSTKSIYSVLAEETGIYFCSRANDIWEKPVKITDSAGNPAILVGDTGDVCVLWVEEQEGLFYKWKTTSGWKDTDLAVDYQKSGYRTIRPLCAVTDKEGNIHIVYARGNTNNSGELVYVKLTNTQK